MIMTLLNIIYMYMGKFYIHKNNFRIENIYKPTKTSQIYPIYKTHNVLYKKHGR